MDFRYSVVSVLLVVHDKNLLKGNGELSRSVLITSGHTLRYDREVRSPQQTSGAFPQAF